jgi:hypothetical protein
VGDIGFVLTWGLACAAGGSVLGVWWSARHFRTILADYHDDIKELCAANRQLRMKLEGKTVVQYDVEPKDGR